MKKKICYITTLSLTIDAFFIPQLKRLAIEGYDVSVVTSLDAGLQERLGEEIRHIPVEMPRGLSIRKSFQAVSSLTKLFKKEKFDLVQYSTPNAALYASIAAKKAKIPIRNYHLMGLRYLGAKGAMRIFLKLLEKSACKNSTHIECVSPSNLEMAVNEKLFSAEKGTVVWNGSSGGIDLSRFDFSKSNEWRLEKRKEYGFTDTDFIYGFVGRITRDKGIQELLSAYKEVKAQVKNAKLVLIGNIDENHNLCKSDLDEILQSKDILHIGAVKDIEKYYPMLDVLVLPSYREGFGNVVIEAQAMGVPVIVSNIPGPIDAMQDGVTGFRVAVKDGNDLAKKMKKIYESDRENMKKSAVEYVKNHFYGEELCKYILERKKTLLGE